MKKIINSIILTLVVILPLRAYALTGSASIKCDDSGPGTTSKCTITGKSSEDVTSISMSVKLADSLEVGSFTAGDSFTGSISDGKISLSVASGKSANGDFTIGILNVKVKSGTSNGEYGVTLEQIKFNEEEIETVSGDVAVEQESGLKSLKVTGGTLSPSFDTSKTGYTVTLDNSTTSFSVEAEAINSSDTVKVTANGKEVTDTNNIAFSLESGKDSMSVEITAGSKSYTLVVKKDVSTVSSDNTLSSLKIAGVEVNLNSCKSDANIITCSVTIPANLSSISINATLKDNTNYKLVGEDDKDVSAVSGGATSILLKVVPKNDSSGLSSMNYQINLTKTGGTTNNSGGNSTTNNNSNSNGNVFTNPETGGLSLFLLSSVMVASLVASIVLYKKHLKEEGTN